MQGDVICDNVVPITRKSKDEIPRKTYTSRGSLNLMKSRTMIKEVNEILVGSLKEFQ